MIISDSRLERAVRRQGSNAGLEGRVRSNGIQRTARVPMSDFAPEYPLLEESSRRFEGTRFGVLRVENVGLNVGLPITATFNITPSGFIFGDSPSPP